MQNYDDCDSPSFVSYRQTSDILLMNLRSMIAVNNARPEPSFSAPALSLELEPHSIGWRGASIIQYQSHYY